VSDHAGEHERIKVLIETEQRAFKGYLHKPVKDGKFRLSDHLNTYAGNFLCLTDAQILERGQQYRVGEKRDFVAVAVSSITYLTPLAEGE
jgi:hypothetical protein